MLANRAARGLASLRVQANEIGLDEAGKFHAGWTPRGWSDASSRLVGFEQLLYLRQPGYGPSYIVGKAGARPSARARLAPRRAEKRPVRQPRRLRRDPGLRHRSPGDHRGRDGGSGPAALGDRMARVLLIVGGGIAAYKSLELVRLLKKAGHQVTPVLTKGGEHFVTAMSLGTLAESQVHTSLWELKDEVEIGHIQLSRAADFVLVCPATADLLAKMAAGIADDLATTLLLATDKPVVVAPAMNVRMWQHAATRRNIAQLKADGVRMIEPAEGDMACGEFGPGRLPEPQAIMAQLSATCRQVTLAGKHVLVTAGPTHEPIDRSG